MPQGTSLPAKLPLASVDGKGNLLFHLQVTGFTLLQGLFRTGERLLDLRVTCVGLLSLCLGLKDRPTGLVQRLYFSGHELERDRTKSVGKTIILGGCTSQQNKQKQTAGYGWPCLRNPARTVGNCDRDGGRTAAKDGTVPSGFREASHFCPPRVQCRAGLWGCAISRGMRRGRRKSGGRRNSHPPPWSRIMPTAGGSGDPARRGEREWEKPEDRLFCQAH